MNRKEALLRIDEFENNRKYDESNAINPNVIKNAREIINNIKYVPNRITSTTFKSISMAWWCNEEIYTLYIEIKNPEQNNYYIDIELAQGDFGDILYATIPFKEWKHIESIIYTFIKAGDERRNESS